MWNLKCVTSEYNKKKNLTDIENKLDMTSGERDGRRVGRNGKDKLWEISASSSKEVRDFSLGE